MREVAPALQVKVSNSSKGAHRVTYGHASRFGWQLEEVECFSDGTPIAADKRHLGPLANKEL